MPLRYVAELLRDPDARRRPQTWYPVAVVVIVACALFYTWSSSSANADAIRRNCVDRAERTVAANRELRVPLDAYADESSEAWKGLYELFAGQPASSSATPEELRRRARFLLLLARARDSSSRLAAAIRVSEPVAC